MDLGHPLDAALRDRLRTTSDLQQSALASAIGRKPSWLNKYINGVGHATVDDVVRMLALLIGVDAQQSSEMERRLLRAWRQIPPDHQEDAIAVLVNAAKGFRPRQSPESNAPAVRTTQETKSRARGKRKAAGE